MIQSEMPVTPQELARILSVFFDASELRDLCFDLEIDYENIFGNKKSDKARELVKHMERRGQIILLYHQVRRVRPNALNLPLLGELAVNSLGQDDPRVYEVQKLLKRLHKNHELLSEWKELHNHLDEILYDFGQFADQIKRYAGNIAQVDIFVLDSSWRVVNRKIERYLLWSQDVSFIGRPFKENENGERSGERWAIEVSVQQRLINTLLYERRMKIIAETDKNYFQKLYNFFSSKSTKKSLKRWLIELEEITRELDGILKTHMFTTDKAIRETASNLLVLSKLI